MDTLSLVIAIIGVILTITSFAIGRLTAARTDGEKLGRMEERLEMIDNNLNQLHSEFTSSISTLRQNIYNETAERHKSIERLHDRIDNVK